MKSEAAADRRLNTLFRHLIITNEEEEEVNSNGMISCSVTSSAGDSVFANVVRAPEDPILGVHTTLPLFIIHIHIYIAIYVYL